MKQLTKAIAAMVLLCILPQSALAVELLIPVGKVIGLELGDDRVTVAAFDDALGADARKAGLKIGDEIVKVAGEEVDSAEDIRLALTRCREQVELTVSRDGKLHSVRFSPKTTGDGPKLGVYLREGTAGIGTVTYYDPETGCFGALGHGVSDARGGLLEMHRGTAYEGRILSVKKGVAGEPGQLRGGAEKVQPLGQLNRNTPQGVFGTTKQGWLGQPLPVAAFEDVTAGPATIRSTVTGDTVREYSVEILKVYPKNRMDNRNFLLKVTDPALLETTGGIVQGMSGSPIIQNGKLVGAVTHVLVNDPTMGYGIVIENMLDAAA